MIQRGCRTFFFLPLSSVYSKPRESFQTCTDVQYEKTCLLFTNPVCFTLWFHAAAFCSGVWSMLNEAGRSLLQQLHYLEKRYNSFLLLILFATCNNTLWLQWFGSYLLFYFGFFSNHLLFHSIAEQLFPFSPFLFQFQRYFSKLYSFVIPNPLFCLITSNLLQYPLIKCTSSEQPFSKYDENSLIYCNSLWESKLPPTESEWTAKSAIL